MAALYLSASVAGLASCDGLLEADLPHLLTDDAFAAASSAETQVNSIIALFECGYTALGIRSVGYEDAMESIAGVFSGSHVYDSAAVTGTCDTSATSTAWLDQINGARSMATTDPAKLVASAEGPGTGVYDKLNGGGWELGREGERLSAIAAIYTGMSLGQLGEFVCEAAIDGSELLTPTDVLNLAEEWITDRALPHIQSHGDFALPNGISTSARLMATSVRARIKWANRDYAGAAADAATVLAADPGFTAWVTREAGESRRNKIHHTNTSVGYSGTLGVIDWWRPEARSPNPVTGQRWPNPIPFTGYLFLGIMPDGRTLEAGNVPVRWAAEKRNADLEPVSLNNGAVADTRVTTIFKSIQGPEPRDVPDRYTGDDDDVPYITWEELRLIQADQDLATGNFSAAIDKVNTIRAAKSLPQISGAYRASLSTKEAVRAVLLEERRREFFAEGGRYWSTKIQNTDVLWFPRREGATPYQGYNLQGGVRLLFTGEYESNPKWVANGGLALRGTGCTGLFGAQAPVAPY